MDGWKERGKKIAEKNVYFKCKEREARKKDPAFKREKEREKVWKRSEMKGRHFSSE